jgi:hypothetical protein
MKRLVAFVNKSQIIELLFEGGGEVGRDEVDFEN